MKALVWGKNNKFIEFLKETVSEDEVYVAETFQDAMDVAVKKQADAVFMLPDYDLGKNVISEFTDDELRALVSLIDGEKVKIYMENYSAFDSRDSGVIGCKAISYEMPLGRNTIRLLGEFKDEMGGELLQKRNGVFFPNADYSGMEIMAEVRNCIGVHDVVAEDEVCQGIALGRIHKTLYTAMVDITHFDGNFALPYEYWKRFYSKLYSEILGVSVSVTEDAFKKVYSGIKTVKEASYMRNKEERKDAFEKCVLDAVNWHIDSGVLPSADGTRGVYEMVRSLDLNIAKNIRGDSSLFTAALFMLAGKYFNNTEWQDISRNITHEILYNRELQIKDGVNKGLFNWFSGIGKIKGSSVYISDTSRCANCVYMLYTMTGDKELRETLELTGEAVLKWFNGDGLIGGGGLLNITKWDLETIQTHDRTTSSEFYEAPMILLKNIYSITKDERYREQIIKTADALANIHPNYGVATAHSKNFTLSRALGVYAVAQALKPGGWTDEINDILEYFHKLQHPCGGFADGQAYFDEKSIKTNMEFAIGFGPEHGNICDLMYCQNTMFYILNILRKCEDKGFNKKLADEMFDRVVDFMLNIQIVSDDKRISGGWMRAYDMDLGEYYGCDKDYGWGAYSILTGWMTGAIPIVFLDMLGMDTMY